jgi:hypothetical protein
MEEHNNQQPQRQYAQQNYDRNDLNSPDAAAPAEGRAGTGSSANIFTCEPYI